MSTAGFMGMWPIQLHRAPTLEGFGLMLYCCHLEVVNIQLHLHWTFLCPWDFPVKNTGVGCHFLLQGIFLDLGIELRSPELAGGFFTTEPPRKPINYVAGYRTELIYYKAITH